MASRIPYFALPFMILVSSLQSVAQRTAALTPGISAQPQQFVRRLPSAGMFPPAAVQLPRSTPEREGVSSKGIAGFLYAVSKSFTSTAIGLAVSEGRMKVSDKVISFFPKDLPDSISPYLSALTVKDLLSMTEGQAPDPTGSVISKDSNWVHSFLSIPI